MSGPSDVKARRSRSAVLSAEGLAALERGVGAAWSREFPDEKLTGEVKAQLMGVSSRTATKILKGERVDVATLEFVFKKVGAEWNPVWGVQDTDTQVGREEAVVWWKQGRVWGPVGVAAFVLAAWFYTDFQTRSLAAAWDVRLKDEVAKGFKAYDRGDYELAESIAREAEAHARQFRDGGALATIQRLQADLKSVKGDFAEANKLLTKALLTRDLLEDKLSMASLHEAMGINYCKMKQWGEAESSFEKAMEGYREMGDPIGVALIQRDLGVLAEEQGHHEEARSILLESRKALAVQGKEAEIADIDGELAMIDLKEGNVARAKEAMVPVMAYWTKKGQPRWIAKSKLRMGLIEQAMGNRHVAKELFEESCKGYSALNDADGRSLAEKSLEGLQAAK